MTRLSDRVDIAILEPHGPGELALLVVRVDGHDEVRHFLGDEARRAIEEALTDVAAERAMLRALVDRTVLIGMEGA